MKVILLDTYDWIKDMTDAELKDRHSKETNSEKSSKPFIDALEKQIKLRGIK